MDKVQHIVLVRFKPDVTQAQADGFLKLLAGLQGKIPGLEQFAGGPYSSPEGLNHGYTHGFVMRFASAAARDNYLPHPEHECAKQAILPFVEAVVAFDFVEA